VKLIVAGGGTGGHLFPGIALAEEIVTRNPQDEVIFVGTARGIEAREVPRAGFLLEVIDVRGLKGKGLSGLVAASWRLPRAFAQSLRILFRHRPDVVLGVGGYASGPLLLAAWSLGIPTAIQEQNATAGMTNRILGRLVRLVFTAFREAGTYFPSAKVHQLGNPIRRQLLDNFLKPHQGTQPDRFNLLVVGGSQGAHAINVVIPEALARLPESLRRKMRILHQTGARDREEVARRFQEMGLDAEAVEFIVDMSAAYARADLVVARAGASTLAELAVCQRASILIPFAAASDDHQTKNAQALVQAGAAVLLSETELSPDRLARELRLLCENPERLTLMAGASGRLGRPEAAREIAEVLAQLAGGTPDPGRRPSPTRPTES
jgi:UDP-N-acetylglucosamine--N-acetylmuramyl-(pentapeptide) pyrophosphoryl-undecaprenol N-acetylglucosamine transferase